MFKLSVIIPVFNECSTLEELLKAVRACSIKSLEIIVVDDCSTDGTRELLRSGLSDIADQVIYHPENQGKGAAIRTGAAFAQGEYIVFQDADLEYDPSEFELMLDIAGKEDVDVVYGSRFLHPDINDISPFWHRSLNKGLTWLSNLFTGYHITDMETCYKLIPRELMEKIELEENRFGMEPEITAKLAALGASIEDMPIEYKRRNFDEGKKIGLKDGIRAVYVIIKYGLKNV